MNAEAIDRRFLLRAEETAQQSHDPSTKVGCVIASRTGYIVATGCNSFPRGIANTVARWGDREMKLRLVVHGEMNAVLNASRVGDRLIGRTMYIAAIDAVTGDVWGGPPCTRCAVEIIQAGVKEIVSWPLKTAPSRWHADLAFSQSILAEAGVVFRTLER